MEPEKPTEVVVRGLPRGSATVAPGDGYGSIQFSAAELEEVVGCGMALQKQLIRPMDEGN